MLCSRAPQLWVLRAEESAVHSLPPPTIPAGTETRMSCKMFIIIIIESYVFFLFSLQIYDINRILQNILCTICAVPIEGVLQVHLSHTSI